MVPLIFFLHSLGKEIYNQVQIKSKYYNIDKQSVLSDINNHFITCTINTKTEECSYFIDSVTEVLLNMLCHIIIVCKGFKTKLWYSKCALVAGEATQTVNQTFNWQTCTVGACSNTCDENKSNVITERRHKMHKMQSRSTYNTVKLNVNQALWEPSLTVTSPQWRHYK